MTFAMELAVTLACIWSVWISGYIADRLRGIEEALTDDEEDDE